MAPGPDDAEKQRDETTGAAAAEAAQPTPEQDIWLLELEEAKRLVEALRVVKSVELFFHDATPNLNKVEATLWCCWSSGRPKRVQVACDKSGEKPTHLEAMRALHAKINKEHMHSGHQHDQRAIAKREELGVTLGAPPGSTAFDRMAAAQAAARLTQRTAEADQLRVEQAMEAERRAAVAQEEATQRRKDAEAAAKRSKAAAEALSRPRVPPAKKQRTAAAAGPSTDPLPGAAAEPMDTEAAAATEEAADPERWESYSLLIFRSLFRKFAKSSSELIDPDNTDETPPAWGDDSGRRGWRNHSQHGMYAHVRHWAQGSPWRVTFMLAELAKYFKVEDAVSRRRRLPSPRLAPPPPLRPAPSPHAAELGRLLGHLRGLGVWHWHMATSPKHISPPNHTPERTATHCPPLLNSCPPLSSSPNALGTSSPRSRFGRQRLTGTSSID